MKLIVRERISTVAVPIKKVYNITIEAIESYKCISKQIGQAKGDMIAYRGAGDPVRLPAGDAGQVLTMDPTQPTGMRWTEAGSSASGTKVLLHNGTGSRILKGEILYMLDIPEEIQHDRECKKAQPYSDQVYYIAAADAANGEDIECYWLPGSICEILVTGTVSRGDPLVVSETPGIGRALPGGTPTVGIALENKAGYSVALMNVMIVPNETQMISNADTVGHVYGTVYALAGGHDTDSLGHIGVKVVPADYFAAAPIGVEAQAQVMSGALSIMHDKPGKICKVSVDSTRVDVGDWLVPVEDAGSAGVARSGYGLGIGYSLEAKAGGSVGKVNAMLHPASQGAGPKKYLYYVGNQLDGEEWNGTLTFQTTGGTAYTMVKMLNNGIRLFNETSGGGSEERCIYVRSSAIDVSGFSRLVIRLGYWTENYNNDSRRQIYFGLANKNVSTVKQSTIDELFAVYSSVTPDANKANWNAVEYELDVSELSGEYNVCVVWAQHDLTGTVKVFVNHVYLM